MSNAPKVGTYWKLENDKDCDGHIYEVLKSFGDKVAVWNHTVSAPGIARVSSFGFDYTQAANAQGDPLPPKVKYKKLMPEMVDRFNHVPKGLEQLNAGVWRECKHTLSYLQEKRFPDGVLYNTYQYPIIPENSNANLFRPTVEYKTLTREMAKRLKNTPEGLMCKDSTGWHLSNPARTIKQIKAWPDFKWKYPICEANSDENLFGPAREKYVYYELVPDSGGDLSAALGEGDAEAVTDVGPHSGRPIGGRYCLGYTNAKSPQSYRPVTNDGKPYKYAVFVDPTMEEG